MAEAQPTTGNAAGGRLGAFVRESGYLRKWLILGVAIGVIAGLGAVVFYLRSTTPSSSCSATSAATTPRTP